MYAILFFPEAWDLNMSLSWVETVFFHHSLKVTESEIWRHSLPYFSPFTSIPVQAPSFWDENQMT